MSWDECLACHSIWKSSKRFSKDCSISLRLCIFHILNAIRLPYDNATTFYWHFYHHRNDNRIEVNDRKKKIPKGWYTSLNFRQEFAKGREGGKTCCTVRQEKKKNWITWPSVKLTSSAQVPHSVFENVVPDSFASSAGKRNISSRSMGIVWRSKWFSDFLTISVKTRQEEYLWRFLQPKNFLWKGLFDLIFSPEKPFFHTNGKHHCHLSGESPEN